MDAEGEAIVMADTDIVCFSSTNYVQVFPPCLQAAALHSWCEASSLAPCNAILIW